MRSVASRARELEQFLVHWSTRGVRLATLAVLGCSDLNVCSRPPQTCWTDLLDADTAFAISAL